MGPQFLSRLSLLAPFLSVLGWLGVPPAHSAPQEDVSFVNDVIPVLTKAGCNAGPCHAKAGGGQNGFQLSLLGFEPADDYAHMVKEGRGRRLFLASPERSLLLRKAAGQTPHGGGVRLEFGGDGYNVLKKWIEPMLRV